MPKFFMNPSAHMMKPGTVAFIPGWIILQMIIITIAVWFPNIFQGNLYQGVISVYFLAFIIGSLIPVFDDILAFIFGPPFAHHSLFHSLFGSLLIYSVTRLFIGEQLVLYISTGQIVHIIFNYYLDYVTLFFPISYQEWGLTDITRISTYWLKAIHYPLILVCFLLSILKVFNLL